MTAHFSFDNSYARLDAPFHRPTLPTPVPAPRLVQLNRPLAEELGLDPDALDSQEGAEILSGNRIPRGAEPIAAAYAGHQFGNFVPQLGDGRAILLGEVVDRAGRRRDIQLKGSGPTPFSRGGDGRAALGPVLREYIVSEAMAALGIPTTRALAAVATGEPVYRETALPGAVLTRVAASHVRIGTFQFLAARGDDDAIGRLADHVIARHDPQAAEAPNPYRALLEGVARRQARLVARWMQVGFIHGVMNTDNMSISGETIDYGPCAFMDGYDPATVFSSIDRNGRYAYANQPGIAQWNLTRLAECLLSRLDPDESRAIEIAQDILAGFAEAFNAAYVQGFREKIGLHDEQDEDAALIQDLLGRMARETADFTLTFRGLGTAAETPEADASVRALFADPAAYDGWAVRWRARLAAESLAPAARKAAMDAVNPAVIPRNHRVEEALAAAIAGDTAPFERLNAALARPYEDRPDFASYAALPPEREAAYRTFCGT
ncbi:hypothetical protein ASG43_03610 [Aureimonas sp. Leaf454]|uniref:protein adenylyltransferase SelO n=1 Tax=Aureimonas sp. Leaf454 TaxID=1736381 RepID=UPI0006F44DC2|nr:YdiU family protein [Aureimonas sp. Leaf454]KQT54676.1 hypothetical protein ASG43_03610 [Aureimonas sp. Leaf454]